jgi:riboflavin transporter FmnP
VAGVAVFSSLALVMAAASQALGLNFPLIPYLQFDLGEVAIILAFFIFGPIPGLVASGVEFGGLMIYGQQVPIGPLLKLFALVSTVVGLWAGTRIASKRAGGLGRLLGSSALVAAFFRAAVMTIPNYYLIVYVYGAPAIEGFLGAPFALIGISLTGGDALWIVLFFTGLFNVLQLAFVTGVSYLVLKAPRMAHLKVGGRMPWFTTTLRQNHPEVETEPVPV